MSLLSLVSSQDLVFGLLTIVEGYIGLLTQNNKRGRVFSILAGLFAGGLLLVASPMVVSAGSFPLFPLQVGLVVSTASAFRYSMAFRKKRRVFTGLMAALALTGVVLAFAALLTHRGEGGPDRDRSCALPSGS